MGYILPISEKKKRCNELEGEQKTKILDQCLNMENTTHVFVLIKTITQKVQTKGVTGRVLVQTSLGDECKSAGWLNAKSGDKEINTDRGGSENRGIKSLVRELIDKKKAR